MNILLPVPVTLGLALAAARLAAYPEKTITIVVPTAAGGGNDAMARAISAKLDPILGQTLIVDNKAGANGAIASEYVARAASDRYTLMLGYWVARVHRASNSVCVILSGFRIPAVQRILLRGNIEHI